MTPSSIAGLGRFRPAMLGGVDEFKGGVGIARDARP